MNNPTPDLNSTVQALNQRVSAFEVLVIELTLIVFNQSDISTQQRKRLNKLMENCNYAGIDTTGQM